MYRKKDTKQWKVRGVPGKEKKAFKEDLTRIAIVLKDITEEAQELGKEPGKEKVKRVWEKVRD